MAEQFRLYLLGGFRLERDGARIQLYSRKVESLFAYLALYPQEHAREKLAALFWGESSDEQARGSLRLALNNLRKQLGSDSILSDRETVQLNPNFPLWTDAKDIADCRLQIADFAHAQTPQIENLKSKIENYSELLPDFYDDWLDAPREELRALFLDAALKWIDHARAQSEYKTAVELAQKVLTVDKANEAAHQHLMFCYSALGDRAAALDQYEFCKRALKEELGIEPSQETRALYETIRKQTETKSAAARLTNLPRPTTSFVGRERELEEIRGLLTNDERRTTNLIPHPSSLITLLGAGGSGKTRLSIQVAQQLVKEFPDGVWWVDLSALQEEAFVPNQVAKALGIQEKPNVPMLETLQANLHTKHLLLVLDNCEHVIDACAQIVQALISNSPISILATSRVRLNVPGELTYQVSTLATPKRGDAKLSPGELLAFEAVKLFNDRVRLHQPMFHLNEHNAPHVVRICQQLDGIPLALELAAAQIQTLSLDEIAARLEQRRELVDASRAHARQQTLHAMLDWSYDLLAPVEQILFRRLAVFAGGWTLEQAIVVAGGYAGADAQWNTTEANDELSLPVTASFVVNALLRNLVSKSLALYENERYRFLETIREHAREKLEAADESDTLQTRHYAYFAQLAERAEPELRGPELIQWGERLEVELDNLRAALDWALAQSDANLSLRLAGALPRFWIRQGHVTEGQNWYDKVLQKGDSDSNPHYLARAYSGSGVLVGLQGDFVRQVSLQGRALEYYAQTDDKIGAAFSLYNFGGGLYWLGDEERGQSLVKQALQNAREAKGGWVETYILNFLGVISAARGDNHTAMQYYEQALAVAQADGDAGLTSSILHNIGAIESAHGNFPRAAELLEESLRLAQARHQTAVVTTTLVEQGVLLVRQGKYAAAAEKCVRGAQMAIEFSLKPYLAEAMEWLGAALGYQHQFERAIALWGAAAALRHAIRMKLETGYLADYEKAVAFVRDQIGEKRFEELLNKGGELSAEQVQELISA